MKKLVLSLTVVLFAAGIAQAQGYGHMGRGWYGGAQTAQTITVSGTLQLQNGAITVKSGDTVYYVPALQQYVGFIDGLREGGAVTLEGYGGNDSNYPYFDPYKITVNGKDYDVSNWQLAHGSGHHGGYGGGHRGGHYRGCSHW